MEERPIDRGWAWMICLGVGVNSLFISGPLRSYGILLVVLTERFETSGSTVSIVLVMITVGLALTSPIAAELGERYGQRRVIFVGGLLNFLGAFLTAFAPNVMYVCVIFGTLSGMGLGCMFAPAMVMIGYYFDKRRSLANGLSTAGGSIGQMTIPLLFVYLIDSYGFQGGMLIYSGLLLHICIAALLLRPITSYKPVAAKKTMESNGKLQSETKSPDLLTETPNNNGGNIYLLQDKHHSKSGRNLKAQSMHNVSSSELIEDGYKRRSLQLLPHDKDSMDYNYCSRRPSLYLLPNQTLSPDEMAASTVEINDTSPKQSQNKCKSCAWFLFRLYDWSLFKDKIWILYAVSVATGQSGYGTTCMFLPPFAAEKGISAYLVSSLITIAGAVTFIGRIGGGAFADLDLIKRATLSAICLSILAVAALILPFVPYYWAMATFAVILGFFGGVYVAQVVATIIELMGMKKMSASFGLALMVNGIIQIPVPLLLGYLKDLTGTYDWALYGCVVMLTLGAISLLIAGHFADKRAQAATS